MAQVRERCRDLPPPGMVRFGDVNDPKPAVLLLPVIEMGEEAGVVLTKRPSTMVHHRDDWVFPGGRVDFETDRSPTDAARREATEELGVPASSIELVGQLSSRGPIVTGYLLDVFVGIVAAGTPLQPDPREVADMRLLSFAALTADGAYQERDELPVHDPGPAASGLRNAPVGTGPYGFFSLAPGEWLWGTQGDALHELLSHLHRNN